MSHVTKAVVPTTTGTFKATTPGSCDISMKAFGWVDTGATMTKSSYIKVNGLTYFDSFNGNPDYGGFDLVTLDTNTCRASNFAHFDTYASAPQADTLANYIYGISDGTHILGVTSDDGFNALNDNARAALKSLGVDATGMVYGDKLIFHAVKGKPAKAVAKSNKAKEDNLYYEEKASTCGICQNNGVLRVNSAGTGFECQCPKVYIGLYCEKFSEAACLDLANNADQKTVVKRYTNL